MAASLLSKSRTDFMLEVACREAENVLLDQRLFILDAERYDAFAEALNAPVTSEQHERYGEALFERGDSRRRESHPGSRTEQHSEILLY
jgi:uncharacterized protein (DUF1778 family)